MAIFVAMAQKRDVVMLMVGLCKCFEMVAPEVLIREAMAVGFPPRLACLRIQLYQQPRLLRAHGSVSQACVSYQGIVAGCSHAVALLTCSCSGPAWP